MTTAMAETQNSALPAQTHTSSIKERVALGRSLRERCARRSHGRWKPPAGRHDPIDLLIEQGKSRVQELLPLRYGRMKASPFAFLRGGAAVMAAEQGSNAVQTGVRLSGEAGESIRLLSDSIAESSQAAI